MIIAIFLFIAAASGEPVSRSRFSFIRDHVAASKNPQVSVVVSKSRGIGFLANRDLSPGELILSVPYSYSASYQDAFPFSMVFERNECNFRLMARAMYDRWVNPNPGMPADYFRHMTDMDDMVYVWDRESQDYLNRAVPGALAHGEAYEEAKAKFLKMMKAFPGIDEICPECVTEAAFDWAFWLVITHMRKSWPDESVEQDPLFVNPEEQLCAFSPIVDTYNHMPVKRGQTIPSMQGDVFNIGDERLEVYTDRAVKKGQEVFISYARENSLSTFLRLGFVVHRNPNEYLYFNFTDPVACLGAYYHQSNVCKVMLYLGAVDRRVLQFLHLEFMKESDMLAERFSPIDTTLEQYYRTIPAAQNDTDNNRVTKEVMLKASLRYREMIINKGYPKCENSYRESVRRLRNEEYSSRKRVVDELCQIVWETQFALRKPIERYMMFMLQHDLDLKRDLELN